VAESWINFVWPFLLFILLMVVWVLISWWTNRLGSRSNRTYIQLYEQQIEQLKRNVDLFAQTVEETKRNTAMLERIAQVLENRSRS
jgi:hypothetical protein